MQKLTTAIADKLREETGQASVTVLNALGIRAQEGDSREKMSAFGREEKQSSAKKVVDRWFPIHLWPESRVWQTIGDSKVPYHKAYEFGMRRLSCAFCVFASKPDLLIAAKHNPSLFAEYVSLEKRFSENNPTGPANFTQKLSLQSMLKEIQAKRDEGLDLNTLGEWVKKSFGFEVSVEMLKALTGEVSSTQPMVILAAAFSRLSRAGEKPVAVTVDWKAGGACVHLDTATDSHHVTYQAYPAAYNASLFAAQFADQYGLKLEENNAPPAQSDLTESLSKSGGPFIGPRGGKWADAEHTISWEEHVSAEAVRAHVASVDTGGKHGKPATVGSVRDEDHVRVTVPLAHLDTIDPADTDRVKQYAERDTPMPAISATYNDRSHGKGKPTLYVPNGNHRVAAARARGDTHIEALVPKSDWDRWLSRKTKPAAEETKPAADPLAVGTVLTLPPGVLERDQAVQFTVQGTKDGKVAIAQTWDGKEGPSIVMPAASLRHFVNDLSGKVDLPATSENTLVNDVINGKGTLLGKGDDGVVFQVGDHVVKMSTTVPYQPMNPGHRTPEAASDMLEKQVEVGNKLYEAGVPGIQRSEFVRHGDKGFQIKPWVEIPETLTREQLESARDSVLAMHQHGYALNDSVQVGIDAQGKTLLFDIGKAAPLRAGVESIGTYRGLPLDVAHDLDSLAWLYHENGAKFVPTIGTAAERSAKELSDQLLRRPWSPALEANSAFVVKQLNAEINSLPEGPQKKGLQMVLSDLTDEIEATRGLVQKAEQLSLFVGPRGGKWADAAHTIHWEDRPQVQHVRPVPAPEPVKDPVLPTEANPIRRKVALQAMLDHAYQVGDLLNKPPHERFSEPVQRKLREIAKQYDTTPERLVSSALTDRIQTEVNTIKRQYPGVSNPRVLDPDFKAWFGDWEQGEASKVIKPTGDPAEQHGPIAPTPVYHGTAAGGFTAFAKEKDKGHNIFGRGFYFTEDNAIAQEYTQKDSTHAIVAAQSIADADGNEIKTLSKEHTAVLNRLVEIDHMRPNVLWAVYRATQPDGTLDIPTALAELKAPSGTKEERLAAFSKMGRMGATLIEDKPHPVTVGDLLSGLVAQIQRVLPKGVHAVIPGPQVFEVYMNIRKPLGMETPVTPKELRSLSSAFRKRALDEAQAEVTATTKKLAALRAGNLDDENYLSRLEESLKYQKERVAMFKASKAGRVYAADAVFHEWREHPDIQFDDASQSIPVEAKALLALKRRWRDRLDRMDGKSRSIFHVTPADTLTWGDVHYLVTEAHRQDGAKEVFTQWAKEQGYDGITHQGGWNVGNRPHKVWIAFEPNQIKAVDSAGFNPETDDITKSHKLAKRMKFQGFDISVEQDVGDVRKWFNSHDNTHGETTMRNPYGYIRRTLGSDGDHVDVYVGPDESAKFVYVVNQVRGPDFTKYDEQKVMLGFPSEEAAKSAYLAHYNNPRFLRDIVPMPLEEFRTKVYAADGRMVKAWESAIATVGIPADRFHLVVKYARQGHEGARTALDAVYAQLEKAASYEGLGGGRDIAIQGTMGHWGRPARSAGENVRPSTSAPPQADWPPGRTAMNKKGRRPKRDPKDIPGQITKVAAHHGLQAPGAHHVHEWDLVTDTTSRKLDSDPDNKANLLRTATGTRELREAGRLRDPDGDS